MDDTGPPTLPYAAPELFFDGEYRYRTPAAFIVGVVGLGVAIGTVVAKGVYHAAIPGYAVSISGGCFGLLGIWAMWAFWTNRSQVVRLTAEGVQLDHRFWPWGVIEQVGAVRRGADVLYLYMKVRGSTLTYSLPTTPSLTDGQYEALRATLDRYFMRSGLEAETRDPVRDIG